MLYNLLIYCMFYLLILPVFENSKFRLNDLSEFNLFKIIVDIVN